jgi:chloramphenicol-sensitive protein RarD
MAQITGQGSEAEDTGAGFVLALVTYLFWGILPLYMKLLDHLPPVEIVAHRIIWSVPIAGAVLFFMGRTGDLKAMVTSPKALALAALTAALVSVNWAIYVWAITSGNALEAALGYYINPLFSVLLGFVLLKEKLQPLQWVAVALAAAAVATLAIDAGKLPVAGLGLTFTWGFYAFFKRKLAVGPNQGFFLEVVILAIPCLLYWVYLGGTGQSHFSANVALMLGAGAVTAIPLMMYANAAKKLRLTTIALMQYITPTMVLILAVFVFDEPFGQARAIAFPMIWAALALYSISMLRAQK